LSVVTSSHAYGIGIIVLIVAMAASITYYQLFYIPEKFEKPEIEEAVLNPIKVIEINMILGSANPDQQDNFVPKLVRLQLGIDNKIIWNNIDETPHTVTPDLPHEDAYTGEFGSRGVIKSGETYEFLFTETVEIAYHCEPHPWMTGTIIVKESRF